MTTPTYPHSLPSTTTHPNYTSIHLHSPIKDVHSPLPSQNIPPSTSIYPHPLTHIISTTPTHTQYTSSHPHLHIKNVETPPPTLNIPPLTPNQPEIK